MFERLLRNAEQVRAQGPRGRYAPSPTGSQHLGNARTALIAWLQVRLQRGVFIMRIEDLDRPRTVEGSATQILQELEWMGLDWDEGAGRGGPFDPYTQSERDAHYTAALDLLKQQETVFRCYCSRKDIRDAASAPHGALPAYPGTCRVPVPAVNDRPPSWRYLIPPGQVHFADAVAGAVMQDVQHVSGDFVIRRADGLFAYQLAVVVDDLLMGITDVVRGMDLLDSTPRQILLYRAFGPSPPNYWHVPLMLDDNGKRMAKRYGSPTVEEFRAAGGTAAQLVGRLAASLGMVAPGREVTPSELLQLHDLDSLRACLQAAHQG